MASQKISSFTGQTLLDNADLFTFVRSSTNFNVSFSDFKNDLGVTGTLNQVGDPLGVPVLDQPDSNTNNIRNLESGAGMAFSVSAQDGIIGKWNVSQDSVGVPITSGLTNLQPVISSLMEGPGIQISKSGDEILFTATAGTGGLNQDQIIYVAKAGSDSNSGLNINSPKLTIQEAILDAIALLPSQNNQITIEVIDTGNYLDAINLPEWVHIDASNAAYDGTCDVSDNCIVKFRRVMRSNAGGSCIKKTTGAGFAKVSVELLIVGDVNQNGFLLNSGVAHLDAGVISVDGGIGIKAKNGSRVSFIISEVQLLNGGTGLGTQVAGGDPNSFSGNVLYAKDDGTGTLTQSKVTGDVVNIQAGSLLVDTLYDMGANTTLNLFANEVSGTQTADPTATVNSSISGVSNFNSTTDIVIDRVLEAVSLATSQEPTGLGIANAIQVEFGAAQFTVSDPVMIDVNGTVTFNVAGMYRVKSVFQFGRTGASGTSEVLFRLMVDGAQLGRSVGVKLGNSDVLNYIDIDNWFNVPAGTVLETEIMRDNSGNNSGGIFKTEPTDEGAGTWSDVPCTVLRIERWASP